MQSLPDESQSKAAEDIYASWDPVVEHMLDQWKQVCAVYGLAYGITSRWYGKWNLFLKVPLVLLTMVNTTVAWGALGSPWLGPSVSTIVTVLTSLQSVLNLDTKNSDYLKMSQKFKQLARRIERELVTPVGSRKSTSVFVADVARQMDLLMNEAAAIGGIIPESAHQGSLLLASKSTGEIKDLEFVVSKLFQQTDSNSTSSPLIQALGSFPKLVRTPPKEEPRAAQEEALSGALRSVAEHVTVSVDSESDERPR